MKTIWILARKEITDGMRNRWVTAATLLMAVLALSLAFLGSLPTGTVGAQSMSVAVVSLSSLTIYLLPLIALLLSFDAVIGEIENGTMLLLLSYPVRRWQVILGKFLGHMGIISFATIVGYGSAAVAISLTGTEVSTENWLAFGGLIGSSVLLGAVFVSFGYLASALVNQRSTAIGICIIIWLFFVLLFDLGVLGILVADKGQAISSSMLQAILLLNPADTYRLFNLSGFESVRQFSGLIGATDQISISQIHLLAALICWVVLPLTVTTYIFGKKEL